jgi:phosphatidylglycerophosphate synthase
MGERGAARRLVGPDGVPVSGGTPLYRRDLVAAAAIVVAVLVALWAYLGLGPAGLLAGAFFTFGGAMVLASAFRRTGTWSLSPADRVTLTRLTLIGGVTAIAADRIGESAPAVMVALASVALILDGVDGRVARRTGTESEFGARFDIEADSFLVLVLSVFVAATMGGWVLAIGLMRYAYVAASWVLPWLRTPLRPLYARKVVAVIQAVVLIVASAELLPWVVEVAAVALALALLVCSFGESVWWQWRHGRNSGT